MRFEIKILNGSLSLNKTLFFRLFFSLLFLWLNDKINDDNEKRSSTTDSRIQLNDKTKQTKVCVSLRFFSTLFVDDDGEKRKTETWTAANERRRRKDTHRMY